MKLGNHHVLIQKEKNKENKITRKCLSCLQKVRSLQSSTRLFILIFNLDSRTWLPLVWKQLIRKDYLLLPLAIIPLSTYSVSSTSTQLHNSSLGYKVSLNMLMVTFSFPIPSVKSSLVHQSLFYLQLKRKSKNKRNILVFLYV